MDSMEQLESKELVTFKFSKVIYCLQQSVIVLYIKYKCHLWVCLLGLEGFLSSDYCSSKMCKDAQMNNNMKPMFISGDPSLDGFLLPVFLTFFRVLLFRFFSSSVELRIVVNAWGSTSCSSVIVSGSTDWLLLRWFRELMQLSLIISLPMFRIPGGSGCMSALSSPFESDTCVGYTGWFTSARKKDAALWFAVSTAVEATAKVT